MHIQRVACTPLLLLLLLLLFVLFALYMVSSILQLFLMMTALAIKCHLMEPSNNERCGCKIICFCLRAYLLICTFQGNIPLIGESC